MNKKLKLVGLLFVLLFLITGCKSTLVVHDASVSKVTPILKDYAGIHGYQFTYQNDQTGSYRLYLGAVYIPNVSQTTKTKQGAQVITSENVDQSSLTSYEQTTWQTVSVPGHYVDASAMVKILQQDDDVVIIIDSNDAVGSSLSDLQDYFKDLGYRVDTK